MTVQTPILFLIKLLVPLPTLVIFEEFFDERDRKNEDQGSQIRNEEADAEGFDKLGKAYEQEEEVEEVLELVEEYKGHKREKCVPLIVYLIV